MLEIAKDESLYSFIFRTHIVFGINDFSNIVTSQGLIQYIPVMLSGTLEHYHPIDQRKILELIIREYSLDYGQSVFEHPREIFIFLDYILSNKRKLTENRANGIHLSYCLKCIRDHINQHGFGFFSYKWSFINQCEIHRVPISSVKQSSSYNTLKVMKSVISGINPPDLNDHIFNKSDVNYISYTKNKKILHILPCLRVAIDLFVDDFLFNMGRESEKEIIRSAIGRGTHFSTYYSRKYRLKDLQNIFFYLKEVDNPKMEAFWNSKVDEILLVNNVNPTNNTVVEHKVKDKECRTCRLEGCAIKGVTSKAEVRNPVEFKELDKFFIMPLGNNRALSYKPKRLYDVLAIHQSNTVYG